MITPSPFKRALFFLFFDIWISLFTLYFAYNLRFNFIVESIYLDNFFLVFILLLLVKIGGLWYFKIYHISWRFVSLYEVKKIFYAHILAYSLFIVIYYLIPYLFQPFPRSVLIIDFVLSLLSIGMFRISKRLIVEGGYDVTLPKTLVIGVSSFSQTLLKSKNDFYVSAIVDDSNMITGSYIGNLYVNPMNALENLIEQDNISSVIIAKEFDKRALKLLYKRLQSINMYNIHIVSLIKKEKVLKKVTVEDLLARHPKDLDLKSIQKFILDKTILITGAGGSIGSEIVRQCHTFGAKKLILIDHSEFNLYTIGQEIPSAILKMSSVLDKNLLEEIFNEYSPDIVIHAAAYKHVPLCESNQSIAVKNNVLGTKNVIDMSIENGVKKLVIISTDKAVRPTNVMGATKRVTELYASNVDSKDTEIVAVRFGNVLGSSGSVIPKFKKQIEEGHNITVTHPDITRYFMLIPEACQLVLQTATIAKGGELFILDMGEPIKIVDLASQMIKLYGKEGEIEIEFTGLRAGEKLYEELLLDESDKETKYSSIFIAPPTPYNITQLSHDIELLLKAKNKIEALQTIVPEFIQEQQ